METIKSDNQQATPYELGWLIGLIEGEGSVGLYFNSARKQIQPRLTITNTDKQLIDFAADIIRKVGINPFIYNRRGMILKPHWKTRFDIQMEGIKRSGKFYDAILPFWMPDSLKRKKAAIVRDFCVARLSHPEFHGRGQSYKYTTAELALYRSIKALNGESSETKSIPVIEVTEDIVHA